MHKVKNSYKKPIIKSSKVETIRFYGQSARRTLDSEHQFLAIFLS